MTPGSNVIEVVLQLVDQVTAPLKGIESSLGRIKQLGALALGGWSINKFIQNIAEAERVTAKLDIAYKNLGAASGVSRAKMDELAEQIQRTTTVSSESVKEAEALLLTFTRVRGEGFEKTLRVAADLSTMMGTELTSAVRMLGRAAQDPTRGFYMLQRAGIVLTAGQKELIKDMAKAGDTAGAYAKLLELVGQKSAGAATAMRDTLGGAITALQNQIGDLIKGDSGSFKGAVDAINELTKTLDNPDLKRSGDTIVELLVRIAGGAALVAAKMIGAVTATAEFNARMMSGSDNPVQRLTDSIAANAEKQAAAMKDIRENEELVRIGYGSSIGGGRITKDLENARNELVKLRAEEDSLRKARAQELRDQARFMTGYVPPKLLDPKGRGAAIDAASAVKGAQLPPLKIGIEIDDATVEETVGNLRSIQEGLRTETQKTAESIRAQMRNVAQAYMMTDDQLAEQKLTRADLDKITAGLNAQLDAVVAKADDTAKSAAASAKSALEAITTAALRGAQTTVLGWEKAAKAIDEALAKKAITPGQAAVSRAALTAEIRSSVLPEDLTAADAVIAKIELIRGALAGESVSADEARAAVDELAHSLMDAGATGFAAEVAKWEAALRKIAALKLDPTANAKAELDTNKMLPQLEAFREATRGAMTDARQQLESTYDRIRELGVALADLYSLSDGQLLKLNIDRGQLDKALADLSVFAEKATKEYEKQTVKVSEFAVQAARTVQDTLASAFLQIGHGWKSLMQSLLMSFATLLANMAAKSLMEAMGLDEVIAGTGTGKGPIAGLLKVLFPPKNSETKSSTGGGVLGTIAGAVAGTDTGVDSRNSTASAAAGCAQGCAQTVVSTVSETMGGVVSTSMKTFGEGFTSYVKQLGTGVLEIIKTLGSGMWKLLSGVLSGVWSFLQSVFSAIQAWVAARATSEAASSWISTAATVATIAAIGGASIPAAHAAMVGEETPEVAVHRALGGLVGATIGARDSDEASVVGADGQELLRPSKQPRHVYNIRQLEFAGLVKRAGTDHRPQLAKKIARAIHGTDKELVKHSRTQLGSMGYRAGGGPVMTGEEAPELLTTQLPWRKWAGSRSVDGQTAMKGGDNSVHFNPQYHITINGAKDDKEMMAQMAVYVKHQDEKTKTEMYEVMRKNGQGRMRR